MTLLVLVLFISWWGGGVAPPAYAQNTQVFVAADTDLIESVETFQFRFAADQKRAIALSKNLRCPQCQNQNLIDLTHQLPRISGLRFTRWSTRGKSDQEVVEYMTSRFGDFVLYKPKLEPSTYLLWGGPILLFILFGCIAYFSIRKQTNP